MSALEPRRAASAGSRLHRTRKRLEDAVELALAALDAFDGDPDLEGTCDDDGPGEDTEMEGASWLLDPDDVPDPLQPPRYGYGCAR